MQTRGYRGSGQILCLRLSCPLCGATADAMLAAQAALPGEDVVTPAIRTQLTQPPEGLLP